MFDRKLFYGPDEEDPNANYTGWDLPENSELRAWIEELPPLHDGVMFQLVYYDDGEVVAKCPLLLQKNEREAIEVLDFTFLAAHRGETPLGVDRATHLALEAPEVDGERREIVRWRLGS